MVYGRSDYFSSLEHGVVQSHQSTHGEESVRREHLLSMLMTRAEMIRVDAARKVDICRQRNVPIGLAEIPEIGSSVKILSGEKRHIGWRMAGMIASNALVGRDGRIKKVASSAIRSMEQVEMGIPNEIVEQTNLMVPTTIEVLNDPDGETAVGEVSSSSARDGNILISTRRYLPYEMPNALVSNKFPGCVQSICASVMGRDADESELYDPARLPPKVYIRNEIRNAAIVREMSGMLSRGKDGIRPLEVITHDDSRCKGSARIRSTLVVRWKGPLKSKARLCLRGDAVTAKDVYGSPTPYRSSLKSIICLAAVYSMDILYRY